MKARKLHLEVLTKAQRQILRACGEPAKKWEAYLAGGTAVAIHLGHRRSEDFDWFTRKTLAPTDLLEDVKTPRRSLPRSSTESGRPCTIARVIASGVECVSAVVVGSLAWCSHTSAETAGSSWDEVRRALERSGARILVTTEPDVARGEIADMRGIELLDLSQLRARLAERHGM